MSSGLFLFRTMNSGTIIMAHMEYFIGVESNIFGQINRATIYTKIKESVTNNNVPNKLIY